MPLIDRLTTRITFLISPQSDIITSDALSNLFKNYLQRSAGANTALSGNLVFMRLQKPFKNGLILEYL
ncbi:MAG TPA: hypothetical protein DIW81_22880 [Planctomycetaceae bacterium]|nr:hypothetical protein [Rubinisphaera sp.]HCS54390.1 hypothetical protein [Planctomycetaceae bacterium]|tara:strand:- start:4268 stop:4471 length:204 start_codon:yes stop_codon:yes gene_type:complete